MKNYLDNETLDNLLEGFQLIGYDWRYKYINETAAKHGQSRKELLFGRTMMEVYPGIEQTEMFRTLERCMQTRISERVENEFIYPDGTKAWFELQVEPVSEGLFILSIDISARKKAEEELRQVNESLEKLVEERTRELAESLNREKKLSEMKSSFVAMASHEFRTPLSAILSSVTLAERYAVSGEQDKGEKHFNRIKSMVRNLTEILQDFLSVDQLEQGKINTEEVYLDLPRFVSELVENLDALKKDGQEINFRFSGEEIVCLDRKILRNVLINLLSNAIKYSEKDIDLETEVQDDKICIRIRDYGIGIPKEQQQEVFSKFFRAKNTSDIQGTGLGLHIVKHYVDLLNGNISFESAEHEGTAFSIEVPLAVRVKA
ncbi:MAG: sensor signal transduction histidine kinase [Crocinitomicaceae bacterium]|jgi:PAS domain S-box-containing protein|nr:sensor signal transduction histidine kinase [Crocinitomicaceae bacterium]